ncbi:MAG: hypothetical protein ACJAX5_002362 [Patiriisocius sp.]|jgi:hypothetical protein
MDCFRRWTLFLISGLLLVNGVLISAAQAVAPMGIAYFWPAFPVLKLLRLG